MVKLVYNLDEISAVMIDPGRYRARLVKCEQTISSKGNPMLTWHWMFSDKRAGKANGKEIRSFTSLLDTALSGLKQHLMAFKQKGKVNVNTTKFIGRYVTLVINTTASEDKETKLVREFSSVAGVLPDKKKHRILEEKDFEDEDEEDDGYDVDDDDEDEKDDWVSADDEDDDEDEEDEDEEPTSRVSRAAAKRKKKKKKKRKSASEDLPF